MENISEDVRKLAEYIIDSEEDDFYEWCDENEIHTNSVFARDNHIYGIACKVLGKTPKEVYSEKYE